jgi:hypothetical protein
MKVSNMLRKAAPSLKLSLLGTLISCTPIALDAPHVDPLAQPSAEPIHATPPSTFMSNTLIQEPDVALTETTQLVPLSKGGTLGQKLVPLSKGGTLGQGLVPLSKGGTLGQRLDGYVQDNRSFYITANSAHSFYVHLYDPEQKAVLASVETTPSGYFHFAQAPLHQRLLLVAINPTTDTEYRAYITPDTSNYTQQDISLETTAAALITDSVISTQQRAWWHSEAGQNQQLKLLRYLASTPQSTYVQWQESSTFKAILQELEANQPPPPSATPIPSAEATASPLLPQSSPTPIQTLSAGEGVIHPTPSPTATPPIAAPTPQPTPTPSPVCTLAAVYNTSAATFFTAATYPQIQQNYLNQLRAQSIPQCSYTNPAGNCNSLNPNEIQCSDSSGQYILLAQGCSQWSIEADHVNLQHTPTLPVRIYTHQQVSINQAFVGSIVSAGSANISLNQGQTQGLIMSTYANINLNNQARFEGVMAIMGSSLPSLNLSNQAQYQGLLLLPPSPAAPEAWASSPVFQNPGLGLNTAQQWSNLLKDNLCPQP